MPKQSGGSKGWVLIGCVFVLVLAGGLALQALGRIAGKPLNLGDRLTDAELQKTIPKRDGEVIRFGFDQRAGAREDAQQYIPFLKYLERATSLRFELRFTAKDGNLVEELGHGAVQLAAVGAGSYLLCRSRYGAIPLVRGVNSAGRDQYQAVIVVAPDSPIRKISELRGKRFAFGSMSSTQGHIIPRIILSEYGILLKDLAGYEYTGSHAKCATAVAAGRFDAGGIQDTLYYVAFKMNLREGMKPSPT